MAASLNGWDLQPTDAHTWALPQITGRVLAGPVWVVMFWLARQYVLLVEAINRGESWGWTYRQIAGSSKWSNHASATAVDFNAERHPQGKSGTFSAVQVVAIRNILAEAGGVLRCGVCFTPIDEMHFEIAPGINAAAVEKFACKLLQRALNDKAGAGLVGDGVRGPKTLAALRAYQAAHGLTKDGVDGPKTWASLT